MCQVISTARTLWAKMSAGEWACRLEVDGYQFDCYRRVSEDILMRVACHRVAGHGLQWYWLEESDNSQKLCFGGMPEDSPVFAAAAMDALCYAVAHLEPLFSCETVEEVRDRLVTASVQAQGRAATKRRERRERMSSVYVKGDGTSSERERKSEPYMPRIAGDGSTHRRCGRTPGSARM